LLSKRVLVQFWIGQKILGTHTHYNSHMHISIEKAYRRSSIKDKGECLFGCPNIHSSVVLDVLIICHVQCIITLEHSPWFIFKIWITLLLWGSSIELVNLSAGWGPSTSRDYISISMTPSFRIRFNLAKWRRVNKVSAKIFDIKISMIDNIFS
jgi:hypothetical protein